MDIFVIVFSVLSGLIGSMGLGSGAVLLIYLTVFLSTEQTKAQGINLLFFIPCAVLSIIIYSKQKLIDKSKIVPLVISGIFGIAAGYTVLSVIDTSLLKKLFGIFLVALAIKEFMFTKEKKGIRLS